MKPKEITLSHLPGPPRPYLMLRASSASYPWDSSIFHGMVSSLRCPDCKALLYFRAYGSRSAVRLLYCSACTYQLDIENSAPSPDPSPELPKKG